MRGLKKSKVPLKRQSEKQTFSGTMIRELTTTPLTSSLESSTTVQSQETSLRSSIKQLFTSMEEDSAVKTHQLTKTTHENGLSRCVSQSLALTTG